MDNEEIEHIRPADPGAPIGSSSRVVVPPDLVARSRPSRHSVPIIRAKRERKHPQSLRNFVIIGLVSLACLAGTIFVVYSAIEAHRHAGYQLVCQGSRCVFKAMSPSTAKDAEH
jgi:hypothetical protein